MARTSLQRIHEQAAASVISKPSGLKNVAELDFPTVQKDQNPDHLDVDPLGWTGPQGWIGSFRLRGCFRLVFAWPPLIGGSNRARAVLGPFHGRRTPAILQFRKVLLEAHRCQTQVRVSIPAERKPMDHLSSHDLMPEMVCFDPCSGGRVERPVSLRLRCW